MSTVVSNKVNIRNADTGDAAELHRMISELAEYERLLNEVVVRPDDLRRWLFGPEAVAQAIIAEVDEKPVGYAVFFRTFSTFRGRPSMYLEDLYVRFQWRGHGIGEALISHVASVAVSQNCSDLQWSVLDWNDSAIGFYKHFGAQPADGGWSIYKVKGNDLLNLAKHKL